MYYRKIISCLIAPLFAVAVTQAQEALTTSDQIVAIGNEYLAARLEAVPELVYLGLGGDAASKVDHGALADNSPEGLQRGQALEDQLLQRLNALDGPTLQHTDLEAWVLWASLREALQASRALRVCRHEWWSLSHMSGWQTLYPRVALQQPVGSAAERDDALRRWAKLPDFITQQEMWLREGVAAGYAVPISVLDRVIGQLDGLATAQASDSPLAAFATRSDDEAYQARALALVAQKILPAVRRHRTFLDQSYRPHARRTLGVSALPDGEACYRAYLRRYTTLPITAKAMFDRGMAAVNENRRTVREVGAEAYGTDEVQEIIRRNNRAANNSFESREQFVAYARAVAARAEQKVAPYFSFLPEQEARVEPYPAYLDGSGQSSRYERSAEVAQAAVFRISTDGWQQATRGSTQILAVHEVWPGHHLQIATANERTAVHPAVDMAANAAYTEGWARYAEALAEEAGVYEGIYARITRRAWPARGMVVDPGIHAFSWSRERAVAFLRESGRFAGEQAHVMVDRIAVLPGQLTAYDTGALEFIALRQEAEQALGDDFSLPAFHDAVLRSGVLPLAALRSEVERWVAGRRMARPGAAPTSDPQLGESR